MTPRMRRRAAWLLAMLALYALLAYVAVPDAWKSFLHAHPQVDDVPDVTTGSDGLPGDPVNLALYGDGTRLRAAMQAAGWSVADPLDLRDDARIVADVLAHRAYVRAPVSRLYLFGRVEDIAFEMAIGNDPARRHHVRFWQADRNGELRWLGAATQDRSVGLASTTGQVTHHITADVDAERDHVLASLEAARQLRERWYVDGFHRVRSGRNAGGDRWQTDGRLGAGRLGTGRLR